jgi:molecular chaperone HtpG
MKAYLGDRVADVKLSDRLTDSACCLVRSEHSTHAFVERLLRERGRTVPKAQRTLEINGSHPLVKHLEQLVEKGAASDEVDALVDVLFGQALLTEGSPLEDPNRFAQSLTRLLSRDLVRPG